MPNFTTFNSTDVSTDLLCKEVNNLNTTERCSFVHLALDCRNDLSFFDYISFIYCAFGPGGTIYGIFVSVIWMFILFVALGVTATDFLCPALFVISKTLHLNQNVAGVTLVAFGNGSPDIFAAIAGMRQGRPELVIGGLFGGATFVTTCVTGSIFLIKSFKLLPKPFLRDVFFYVISITWVFVLFIKERKIRIYDGIGFLLLYLLYVGFVIASKFCSKNTREDTPHHHGDRKDDPDASHITFEGIEIDDDPDAGMVIMKGFLFLKDDVCQNYDKPPPPSPKSALKSILRNCNNNNDSINQLEVPSLNDKRRSRVSIFDENSSDRTVNSINSIQSENGNGNGSKRSSIFSISQQQLIDIRRHIRRHSKEFLEKISPIDLNGWKQQNWGGRSFEVIKSPIRFFLLLTTPMADPEGKHHWNKYLSILHCITGPIFVVFATGYGLTWIAGTIPLAVVVLILSAAISIVIVLTSSYEVAPFYYKAYSSYLGFAVGVVWIYCISNEIVGLLRSIGIAFNLSDAIVGITILAWGNSLLDFVSNFSIARKGLPRMAISACFGAPLMALLIGVGLPSTIELITDPSRVISLHPDGLILIIYSALAGGLCATIIKLLIYKFYIKRYYGGILIGYYLSVMIIALLIEWNIIKFTIV